MRLQKFLAMNGVASRRQCEAYIAGGLVTVNGQVVTEMGVQIDPVRDEVTFRGKTIKQQEQKVAILLHKPMGVVSTASDQYGRQTVVDLVPLKERVYPVGRLDYLTTGLILLTNDGDLALKLTHPRYETEKVYHAELYGIITEEKMRQFRKGIPIEDYVTLPARIHLLHKEKDRCQVEIVLREGRNRQVRNMCEALGYPVSKLKRVAIGPLTLGDLQPGQWRYLNQDEVNSLMKWKGRRAGLPATRKGASHQSSSHGSVPEKRSASSSIHRQHQPQPSGRRRPLEIKMK